MSITTLFDNHSQFGAGYEPHDGHDISKVASLVVCRQGRTLPQTGSVHSRLIRGNEEKTKSFRCHDGVLIAIVLELLHYDLLIHVPALVLLDRLPLYSQPVARVVNPPSYSPHRHTP